MRVPQGGRWHGATGCGRADMPVLLDQAPGVVAGGDAAMDGRAGATLRCPLECPDTSSGTIKLKYGPSAHQVQVVAVAFVLAQHVTDHLLAGVPHDVVVLAAFHQVHLDTVVLVVRIVVPDFLVHVGE